MLWLNTCMGLLLAVAMAHINSKHTLGCMQKIAQKNCMLFLVTSIHFGIHNPVPSWYCRCCVGDWYKLLSVMHTHLPAYSSQLHTRYRPMWMCWFLTQSEEWWVQDHWQSHSSCEGEDFLLLLCWWRIGLCVCAQWGERLLCGRFVHHVCSCWSEL